MNVRVIAPDVFGAASLAAFQELADGFASPVVGLATGNSPVPLYEALRSAVLAATATVEGIRPFAIDEYGGARQHHCSNRAFFADYWDSIPGARPVQQFDPEAADRDVEAARFAALLAGAGGLDVAILGIGMNGHLAFNEPGSPRDSPTRGTALTAATIESSRPCWADAAPNWGLTLGLRELLGARAVLLLANGAHKANIVRQALEGPIGSECPASYLQLHRRTIVVLDAASADA